MKTEIRTSAYKDYVAVDRIDEDGKIIKNLLYLQKGKPVDVLYYDDEDKKYIPTKITFNGHSIDCIDDQDFEWDSPIDELIRKNQQGINVIYYPS